MYIAYESNELRHYGVLGMKWGVRKANKIFKAERKAIKKKYKGDIASTNDSAKKKELKLKKKAELRKHLLGGRTEKQLSFDSLFSGDSREVRALMQRGDSHKKAVLKTMGDYAATSLVVGGVVGAGSAIVTSMIRKKFGV